MDASKLKKNCDMMNMDNEGRMFDEEGMLHSEGGPVVVMKAMIKHKTQVN